MSSNEPRRLTGGATCAGWRGRDEIMLWDAGITRCGVVTDGVAITLPGEIGSIIIDFKGLEEFYLTAKTLREEKQ